MFFPVAASHQFIPGVYTTSEFLPYEVEVIDAGDAVSTYTRYTEGSVLVNPRTGERKKHKDLIIRKIEYPGNGKNCFTRYEKAYAFWEDRYAAEYIPISRSFSEKDNFTSFQ